MKKNLVSMMLLITLIAGAVNPAAVLAAEPASQALESAQEETTQEELVAAQEETAQEETGQEELVAAQEETAQEETATEQEQEETNPEQAQTARESAEQEETDAGQTAREQEETVIEAGQEESVQEVSQSAQVQENAEETEEIVYSAEIEPLEETLVLDDIEETSAEELFAGYVDDVFGAGSASGSIKEKKYAYSTLSGYDLNTYNFLAEQIQKIAAGELTYTIIEITPETMGLEQTSWTAEELGVDTIWELDEYGNIVRNSEGKAVVNSEAASNARAKTALSAKKIIKAVLSDFPYDLYWYEKTSDGSKAIGCGFSVSYDRTTKTYSLQISTNAKFYFEVADEFADSQYEVDTTAGQTVQTSVENAQNIVTKYSDASDLEKLRGYKNEICDLVSYNYSALSDDTEYGNPWQMIWVFDGDPDTKVVCEGYSKAFKYLCDQTDFADDIGCITATGILESGGSAGGHMWNVVTMEDGKNYLVDVTNCDISSGASDRLFLVGSQTEQTYTYIDEHTQEEVELSGYYFSSVGIAHYYDLETESVFTSSDLTLCGHNYGDHSYKSTVTAATCTEEGSVEKECSICGYKVTEVIPATGHSYVYGEPTKKATCTEEGSVEKECSVCGYKVTEVIPATGHTWNTYYTVDKPATGLTTGLKSIHCSACGAIDESTVQVIPVLSGSWEGSGQTCRYLWSDGTYPKSRFMTISGKTYFFNASGYRLTGWQKICGYWYYFNTSGVMLKSWQKIGNYWYYFNAKGVMLTSWQKIGNYWYYFNTRGAKLTGWQKIGSRWYYLNTKGVMLTGWQKIGKYWYYLASGGAMQTGWQKIGSRWYYFASSGAMLTGWQKINSRWYYFASGGAMVTGTQVINGTTYTFSSGGALQ